MMLQYFQELASGIEGRLATAAPDDLVARKKLALATARLGTRLFSGNELMAWCGVCTPFDLLNALGVTSAFVEFVGATLAGNGDVGPLLEAAEQAGYAPDACGFHRAVTGATLVGLMPQPELFIASSAPCSGGMAVIEDLARRFGKRLFVLDVPHDTSDAAVEYLASQLRDMVDFVTAHTGEPLDQGRLRAAMDASNRASAALAEAYELAARVPTPARRRDQINLALAMALLFGTEDGVEVAEAYRDEFARKVEQGIPGVPGEKLRILWVQNRIQFRNPVEALLEEEFGAAVVADEFNTVNWQPIDLDDPFPGLARRVLSLPLIGPVDKRLDHLRKMAGDYRVDGAINPCNWGCRQGTGARGLVERGLKEIGVPVLNLEVDCVDARNFGEGQMRTRIGAFMEMLAGRRSQGSREVLPTA